MIDAAASLAERLHREAPQVHILTTSREALRVEGENVHLLLPLDYPVVRDDLTAAEALATPAVQLFMERAFASGYTMALSDADAPTVAAMCSRLDGIALAIELAGSRVGAYGLQATADLLSNRFKLLWQGRRSAPPRQQTLTAMLDWSFNLLSARDRRVLTQLSVFIGLFTLEAAQAVAADGQTDAMEVAEAIASLIDKSLIWVVPSDGVAYHRLLDPTHAYAAKKLAETAEANAVAKRHALYYAQYLSSRAGKSVSVSRGEAVNAAPHMGNVRAALDWSFSSVGEAAIGVQLAAAAAPLFFELSLLVECVRWCEQGLASLPASDECNETRLALQANLAASAMFTRGNGIEVRHAIDDGVRIAEALGDLQHQLHLLAGLNIFLIRIGDFQGAVAVARRSNAIAQEIDSPAAIATGEWMLGVAYHLVGDQAGARRHCERGLAEAAASDAAQVAFFGYDHRIRGLVALARSLWLTGFPDRAVKTARRAIDEAVKRDQPVDLCIALIYTATVFLWRGDLDEAEQLIRQLVAHAARHSLGPYHAVGMALTGELTIARGDPSAGIAILQRALWALQSEQHHVLTPAFHRALAEGLVQTGEIDEAAAVLEAATVRNDAGAASLNGSELLRVRGEISLRMTPADPGVAEQSFRLSLRQAKEQSALSLELRSAMGLARLWANGGRSADAADLLEPIYRQFGEGHATTDLIAAGQLLAELGRRAGPLDATG
ncbi:MAG: transcriptional regulator [Bradyrhizobium sp.]|nr:transcriptional regulator [Bradyrhizobium sp.]